MRLAQMALLSAASTFTAAGAFAQAGADDEDVSVQDRPRPEYAALGIRLGQFLAFPEIILSAAHKDNVYALQRGGPGDAIFSAEPTLRVGSDWNQNAVSLSASGVFQRYVNHPNLDNDQFSIAADGTLNVRTGLIVSVSASAAKTEIPRNSDAYAHDSTIPLYMDPTTTSLAVTKAFNRLTLSDRFSFTNYNYTDGRSTSGAVLTQDFRNHDVYGDQLRAEYYYTSNISFFAEEAISFSYYNQTLLRSGMGTTTLVGSTFHLTHLLIGDVGVGLLTSDFQDRDAKAVVNPTARVKLAYFLTPLVTITVNGQQQVVDSGIRQSPAYVAIQTGGRVDYELLRNFLLSAALNGTWNEYRAVDRTDRYLTETVGATYLANRGMALAFVASHVGRSSGGAAAGPGSQETRVAFSVTLRQ